MSRQLRLEFPGATYHVVARGNNRESIARDERDVAAFLASLGATCARYAWRVYCWCIMPNHYHLVLETTAATLSVGMRRHNSTYAQLFNKRYERVGHVFQGRFKALVVADETYLRTVLRYVELNPWRAALVRHPVEWPWSSIHLSFGYAPAPSWSAVREIWGLFGATENEGMARYREFLLDGMQSPPESLPVSHALVIGDDHAAVELQARVRHSQMSAEVPREQRYLAPSIDALFFQHNDVDEAIGDAYARGFSLRAIASYLGLHYSTVSKIARRKTPRKRASITALRGATARANAVTAAELQCFAEFRAV
ncbi:MAG: transposase [Gemmatimonadaceae bacterium]